VKLWRSGIFISALGFVGGLGNFWFQGIISRRLKQSGEFGYVSNTLGLIELLSLPLAIVSTSLVHYIAHYRAHDESARLQGLLGGFQRFLLRATVAGSLIAAVAAIPVSRYFGFRPSLAVCAIAIVIIAMWAGYAIALCQGMAWFKRLSVITLLGVTLRLIFGYIMTAQFPTAEVAVAASAVALLANLILLYWHKDIFKKGQPQVSPWDKHFVTFLIIAAACLGGTYLFTKADTLVSQRYFVGSQLDSYTKAGLMGRSLVMVVAPLLTVVFTSRSGKQNVQSVGDQKILLGLYAIGLAAGAAVLVLFRQQFITILSGQITPEASQMLVPFTVAMAVLGLIQAIGIWSLASRWFSLSILYGALGLAYWLTLFVRGHTPADLLSTMPWAAAAAFIILCVAWLLQLKRESSRQVS
jgi:O-antigen/teichoic acid export membrane protein